MERRLRVYAKQPKPKTPNLTPPVQGMFNSRPFVLQQAAEKAQQVNFKTSLAQVNKYGHSPSQIKAPDLNVTAVQPKMDGRVPSMVIQPKFNLPWGKKKTQPAPDLDKPLQLAPLPEIPAVMGQGGLMGELERENPELLKPLPPIPGKPLPEIPQMGQGELEQAANAPRDDNQALAGVADMSANTELEASAAERPKKTKLWDNVKEKIPLLHSHNAKANKRKALATTGAITGGSVLNTVGQHSNLITHTAQAIPPVAGAGVALPLTVLGAARSGRQAVRARERAKIASGYAENNAGESPEDEKLREIAKYTATKQGTRAKKLGFSSGAGTLSAGAGITSLATGVVTPPGIAAGITSGVLGAAGAAPSVYGALKAGYKSMFGTKGKNRTAKATELYGLATEGHANSINFMQDVGILKGESRPNPEAKGYYAEDLQDESKREKIIEYAKQKMRS